MEGNKESILVICAHNDDQAIGVGGTLARYAKEGKHIVTIIMSFGELSNPLFQKKVIRKIRVKESISADKVLGYERTYYLGLKEGKFTEESHARQLHGKIAKIIKDVKPSKIFTHSPDDPHRDHKDTYNFVMEIADMIDYKGDVFSFNIWNLFINLKKRNFIRMVVDISDTFRLKLEAIRKHKSQKVALISLMWSVYFQAVYYGLKFNTKYAEVFYKVR